MHVDGLLNRPEQVPRPSSHDHRRHDQTDLVDESSTQENGVQGTAAVGHDRRRAVSILRRGERRRQVHLVVARKVVVVPPFLQVAQVRGGHRPRHEDDHVPAMVGPPQHVQEAVEAAAAVGSPSTVWYRPGSRGADGRHPLPVAPVPRRSRCRSWLSRSRPASVLARRPLPADSAAPGWPRTQ